MQKHLWNSLNVNSTIPVTYGWAQEPDLTYPNQVVFLNVSLRQEAPSKFKIVFLEEEREREAWTWEWKPQYAACCTRLTGDPAAAYWCTGQCTTNWADWPGLCLNCYKIKFFQINRNGRKEPFGFHHLSGKGHLVSNIFSWLTTIC